MVGVLAVMFVISPLLAVSALVAVPLSVLVTRQIGHVVTKVRGLHEATVEIALTEDPPRDIWVEVTSLDLTGSAHAETVCIRPARA
mgnify:CR=1 FL=1